jgi:Protein of unknown function (DUF3467)
MNQQSEDPSDSSPLEGHYANYFKVGHNAFEFLLDFGQYYRERQRTQSYVRIITVPIYAKALLKTLGQSIEQYEQTFGTIPEG